MTPIVAIVGRPNVGKSALFNRLVGKRKAIVKGEPGTTRDLNYSDCEESGHTFTLVDTGGFEPAAKQGILKQVKEQTQLAIEEADMIIYLMDGRTGPMPQDSFLVDMLRKTGKKVIYAANKIDAKSLIPLADEFYCLGVGKVRPVSAEHGFGVNELFDAIFENLSIAKPAPEIKEGEEIKVAIVGRPNAGKSSLLNKLIGKTKTIVSELPGTTRDAIDTPFERGDKKYLFIDTAGISRKNRIARTIEAYCVMAAIKTIDNCDVSLLIIDGFEGARAQDEKIAGIIEERGKVIVIVVNKWDLVEKKTDTQKLYEDRIREAMPFLSYAPVIFLSALTGRGAAKIFDVIDKVMEEAKRKLPTPKLNQLLKTIASRHTPPSFRGKEVKFYYITQTGTNPQKFTIFTNSPEGVGESYRRYLVNRFRESLDLKNVPIRIFFRSRR